MTVTYHLDVPPDEAQALAEAVLLEQSVETPRAVAERYPFVREHILGTVRSVDPDPSGGARTVLTLPDDTAAADPAQLLNVLFSNVSLLPQVSLVDFDLPPDVRDRYRGPRFGIAGLRERTGVHRRPLTATALKPVGLQADELAALCRTFAEGGIDIIKDDHYLADHSFCPFETRVRACQDAVDDVAARTGRRAVYAPSLSGTPDQVRRQADLARAAGVRAVLVAPMLLGLPFVYELTREHLGVPVLAHPSFGGSPRVAPAALFGRLFRLFGADAVIFPNYGGRFAYSPETCTALARTLRAPWGSLAPAFPVPAGGMTVERAGELVGFFGRDTILLIGGSLLRAGDDLLTRVRELVARVSDG